MNTSDGLRDLLMRHNIKPTGDSKKDLELARSFMPRGYNEQTRTRDEIASPEKASEIEKGKRTN